MQFIEIQNITKLPLQVIVLAGNPSIDIIVKTPWGDEYIKTKKEYYSLLLGRVTQIDVHTKEIIIAIKNLEEKAKEHLLDAWVSNEKCRLK